MEIGKDRLRLTLEAVRAYYLSNKINNKDDLKLLIQLEMYLKDLEQAIGVQCLDIADRAGKSLKNLDYDIGINPTKK